THTDTHTHTHTHKHTYTHTQSFYRQREARSITYLRGRVPARRSVMRWHARPWLGPTLTHLALVSTHADLSTSVKHTHTHTPTQTHTHPCKGIFNYLCA